MSTGCLFFGLLAFQMSSSSTVHLKDCFYIIKNGRSLGVGKSFLNLLGMVKLLWPHDLDTGIEISPSGNCFQTWLLLQFVVSVLSRVSCLHAVPTLHVCVSVTIHLCLELLHHTIFFSTTLPIVFDAGLNADSFICLPPRCLCYMRWYPGSCWLGARSRTPGPTSTLTVESCCSTTASPNPSE